MSYFNYATLNVSLVKSTRTLFITLKEEVNDGYIGLEQLFELETLLGWCTSKVEIKSIFISSNGAFFSKGINKEELKKMKQKRLIRITEKTSLISQALIHLPQTVIVDYSMGANNIAAELGIGADIRIAHEQASLRFNHTDLGLIPCSGGLGLLTTMVGPSYARNWILSGSAVSKTQLLNSGYLIDCYTSSSRDQDIEKLLVSINKQAGVPRIQAKLGLYEGIKDQLEQSLKFEKQISKASMITQDWQEDQENFMDSKHMSQAVKLSLVKQDDEI